MRCYVDVPWGQVHARTAGDGDRHLVLLHQWPSSSAMWEEVIPRFASSGYRVVALDFPGYGMSDPPPEMPDLAWYGEAVYLAVTALGVETAWYVGHYSGSAVALRLNHDRPAGVHGLAVYGIPQLDAEFAEIRFEPPSYNAEGTEILEYYRKRWNIADSSVASTVAVRALAESLLSGSRTHDLHRAVAQEDHRPLFASVECPLLALAGGRDAFRHDTARVAKLIPTSRFDWVGDSGMDVADERPDEFVAVVDAFIRGSAERN